jgi:hypothetical protein
VSLATLTLKRAANINPEDQNRGCSETSGFILVTINGFHPTQMYRALYVHGCRITVIMKVMALINKSIVHSSINVTRERERD